MYPICELFLISLLTNNTLINNKYKIAKKADKE